MKNDDNLYPDLVKSEVIEKSLEVFQKYQKILKVNTLEFSQLKIIFDRRVSIAGSANYHKKQVRYNIVMAQENLADFLTTVVPHEIAHIFQRHLHPNSKPHGKEWRGIMLAGGYKPERCHNYDNSTLIKEKKPTKKYYMQCPCRTIEVSRTIYFRQIHGKYSYKCRECGGMCKSI